MSETPSGTRTTIIEVSIRSQSVLSAEQLAQAAGITRGRLARLVELGLIEPATPETEEFPAAAATRLKRMLRLRGDLGVNLAGAAVIVDLLERLEQLEAQLRSERPER